MLPFERVVWKNGAADVRLLELADADELQKLCERCTDYYETVDGRVPGKEAGKEILTELPPGKGPEDKFVLGYYRENRLIAVVDLVKDYKVKGEWIIGLLMISPEERGNGLGGAIHESLRRLTLSQGADTLRIGVVEENSNAVRFWKGIGYQETGRVSARFGSKENIVIVYKLGLQ